MNLVPEQRIEKAEAELVRQRRRRKWALHEVYMWRDCFEHLCKEMEEAEAELSKQNESIALVDGYIDKLKKELVEAEKEIYERARGEEKEWERAEKAEAELARARSLSGALREELTDSIAAHRKTREKLAEAQEKLRSWAKMEERK